MTDVSTSIALKDLLVEQKKMQAEYEVLKKDFQKRGQEILKKSFSSFFEAYPKVKAITWTQYTPYFNDGEACVFGVGDMWVLSKKSYEDWQEEGGGYAEEYDVIRPYIEDKYEDELTKEEKKNINVFVRTIQALSDDLYLDMFGDHVYVIATRKGFKVEEYEHD